jgi:hypothetical protein
MQLLPLLLMPPLLASRSSSREGTLDSTANLAVRDGGMPPPLPPANPPWPPTWNMSASTITMVCNGSGWSDSQLDSQFGIVSYDWSNAKAQWAAAKPMDCEERLAKQAKMTKAHNKDAHVFAYRNCVKALPWFASVREKLDDPAYSGFFLKFKKGATASELHVSPCAPENMSKCSVYYHDQKQTPAVPVVVNGTMSNPDGDCIGFCDSGLNPTGEYLWDHRNGSMLRDFLIDEHILGPTGVGNGDISGLFIDDFWCSGPGCVSADTFSICACCFLF